MRCSSTSIARKFQGWGTHIMVYTRCRYANANSEAEPLLTYARDFDAASFVTSDLKTHAADAASGSKDRALLEADREERCAQIAAELCRPTNRNTAVMSDIAAHAVRRGLAVLLPLMKGFPPMLQHILAALRYAFFAETSPFPLERDSERHRCAGSLNPRSA